MTPPKLRQDIPIYLLFLSNKVQASRTMLQSQAF